MSRIKMLNVNLGFNFGLVYLFMFLGRIPWVLNDNQNMLQNSLLQSFKSIDKNFSNIKGHLLNTTFLQNSRKSSLTFIPRLIYNRTIRAIENLRGKEEIELVTLVNNFEKIEERFKRRKDFLNEQCEKLGLNETTDTYDLDDITDNILAGKSLEIFTHLILVIKKFTFSLNYLKKNHHKISLKQINDLI